MPFVWPKAGSPARKYDPAAHSAFVDRIIAEFTPEFFVGAGEFGAESQRPVFVVGLPRSGTTLLEQILAGHSQVFAAGELLLARDGFAAALRQWKEARHAKFRLASRRHPATALRHLEELQRRNATALRVVDKMPDNYLYLGFLATLFPAHGSSTAGATCATWPYRVG